MEFTRRGFFALTLIPFVIRFRVVDTSGLPEERLLLKKLIGREVSPPLFPKYPQVWRAIRQLEARGEVVDLFSVRQLAPELDALYVRVTDEMPT